MLRHAAFALVLLGASATGALAGSTVTLQDRQQAACYDDAQRLCGDFMPDSDKVEACMLTMKAKVSARCRKFYED